MVMARTRPEVKNKMAAHTPARLSVNAYLGVYPRCDTQMPTKVPLQPAEERLGYPTKIPNLGVRILLVVRNRVREDVIDLHVHYLKAIQELFGFLLRVNISDWAPFLCLRITSNQ